MKVVGAMTMTENLDVLDEELYVQPMEEAGRPAQFLFAAQEMTPMEVVDESYDDVRWDRVMELREAIAAGSYHVPAAEVADALVREARLSRRVDLETRSGGAGGVL